MATEAATQDLDLPRAMIDVATSASEWVIILPVVLCLIGAAVLLILRNSRNGQAAFAGLVTLAVIICDIELVRRTIELGPQTMTMGKWLPPFGISFTADTLGASFALASALVTLVVILYSHADIAAREVRYGFYPLVILLLAGVTGAFLTGDLFNLYVWFELMLIASFGLIIMGGRKVQLDGAIKYGFINFLATTFFLIALAYLYGLIGTLNMADIVVSVSAILSAPDAPVGPMTTIAALLLLAFGMKAAAFPVNAWLPASYHTPSAAVSALFGGLLTKVGAYVLLRVLIMLMPASRELMDPVITGIAVVTLIAAPLGAMSQTNLRRSIGFLLIGGIGAILAGIATPSLRGVTGASIYAFSSIFTISAFYLVAGLVERMTGENDTRLMGGLYAASSPVSILFLILVFALAGMPPFLGFWPKVFLVEAAFADDSIVLVVALLLNAFFTTIAGSRMWAHIFWRPGREGRGVERANDRLTPLDKTTTYLALVPTAVLVAIVVVLGLQPNMVVNIGRSAASNLIDPTGYISATGLAEDMR